MRQLSLSDFDRIPQVKDQISGDIDLGSLPSVDSVVRGAKWTADMTDLFSKPVAQVEDRSSGLARMAFSGAEMGWTDEQIAAVLYDIDNRWKKYTTRSASSRDAVMIGLINKAREKIGYAQAGLDIDLSKFGVKTAEAAPVVTEEQIAPLIYGFHEFVKAEFPINWLVEGLVPEEGMMFVTGFPGTGKTQFALQLGAYLALGHESFLKWNVVGGAKRVLFLSLEMGAAPLHLFAETIGKSYDLKKLDSNFRVMPIGEPIPLDTAPGQAFLEDWLTREKPDLLIVDSLQLAISKEMTDETAAKNLMHYLANARKKHGCAVLMIHHNRKKSAEAKQKDITSLSDMYGSIFFAANADAVIGLDKLNEEGLLSVHTLKNRLGKEHAPFQVVRDDTLHFSTELESLTMNVPTRGASGLDV